MTNIKQSVHAYESWLRRMAVRYVVVTDAPADYSSRRETQLVTSGATSLVPVRWFPHMTVYELPDATPLITGPADANVMWFWPQRLVASFAAPGAYRVRIRWSPYWHSSGGCVSRTVDGLTKITTLHAGILDLRFAVSVRRGLQTLAGTIPACSKTGNR